MGKSYKITDAERAVLEVLGDRSEPVQTADLLEQMKNKGREWKRQTLNTLLSRLDDKEIVNRKRGYVEAALSEDELLQKQTQGILDNFYGGKLGNFCIALIGKEKVKEEDIARLNTLMDELRGK